MSDTPRRAPPRYVVGIDLGTTNTVVAFADSWAEPRARRAQADREDDDELPPPRPPVHVFPVAQLVAPGEVEARAQLPSFRYHPATGELSEADLELGLSVSIAGDPAGDEGPSAIGGVLAQRLGGRVPGRLVASAKSWLCHAGVDRKAPILPWGAEQDVPKVSPVTASAGYLAHVRAAWDAAHPDAPLAEQQVVLTVPASFDEIARALTLEAAERAGLPKLRLLEEPQAAFYDWLDRHADDLAGALGDVGLVLVVDAGGGTTDLSLIRTELLPSGPKLTRIAVGEHLLLGGDNMDHALARLCEPALAGGEAGRLPAARFAQLLQQCREAKQLLLSPEAPEAVRITLLGKGSSIMAGRASTELKRADVETLLLDGFLPEVELSATPATRRTGLMEFGLPYAADPVISKHVASFLRTHRAESAEALGLASDASDTDTDTNARDALPDGLLFNGGVFASEVLSARMRRVLATLRGRPMTQLDNPDPGLAVARGAVAYGLSRRGIGLKIGGGSPRSYYLHVTAEAAEHDAVCVLPRGAEEGQRFTLSEGTFALRVGRPVRFALRTSTAHRDHKPDDLVALDDSYEALPDLVAVIEQRPDDAEELKVELHAQLTEVGTLEMSLVSVEQPSRRYRLEFQLRGQSKSQAPSAPARVGELHPRFREATELVQLFYGKSQKSLEGRKVNTLRGELEKVLGARASWETPLLRELFSALLAGAKRRRRSAAHERVWLSLCGYCLRPGFGYPVDDWRVDQLWPLYEQGVQFSPDAAVWAQFWILWRRVAGGLSSDQHTALYADLAFELNPDQRKRGPRPKGPRKQGFEEMVRLASCLERLDAAQKAELGDWLLVHLDKGNISQAAGYWSLGRLGARQLWYGSAHTVVSPAVAEVWLSHLLSLDLARTEQGAFAVTQLARLTHDRARDISEPVRARVLKALAKLPDSEARTQLVREGGELDAGEATQVFGESLPAGLRLV